MSWLSKSLCYDLPEEYFDYLLGRGVSRALISEYNFACWECSEASENPSIKSRYGALGEKFEDRLIVPLYSPKGSLIGIEGRAMGGEGLKALRFLLPEAEWNPIFVGLSYGQMEKIWAGADVWLVEGVFDMTSLQGLLGSAVVVLGTLRASTTNKHLNFLKRFVTGNVYVAYDNDLVGRNATYGFVDENGRPRTGVVDKIQGLGLSAYPVKYAGEGKDPNEIWQRGGDLALQEAFSHYI